MKMSRFVLLTMVFALSLKASAESVSAYSLIGNQQYWHGKTVTVTGVFFADRASLLYLNLESMKYRVRNDSFLLDADRDFIKSFEYMSGNRITIVGKFVSEKYLGASGIIEVDEVASEKLISDLYGPPQKVKDK